MARSPVSDADTLPDVNIGRVSTSVKQQTPPSSADFDGIRPICENGPDRPTVTDVVRPPYGVA